MRMPYAVLDLVIPVKTGIQQITIHEVDSALIENRG